MKHRSSIGNPPYGYLVILRRSVRRGGSGGSRGHLKVVRVPARRSQEAAQSSVTQCPDPAIPATLSEVVHARRPTYFPGLWPVFLAGQLGRPLGRAKDVVLDMLPT